MSGWKWAHLGESVELHGHTPGLVLLTVDDDGLGVTVTLNIKAGQAMVTELVELFGHPIADGADEQAEHAAGLELELKEARTVARGLRNDVERMKTAGQHHDDLTRELELRCERLEREVELARARATRAERELSGGLS